MYVYVACVCVCGVWLKKFYSPCLCVWLFFLSKNIHVLHANVCHMFYVYRSSFCSFPVILRMDTVCMPDLCLPRFPRMHQGLYTYMYIFFFSCSMNNCTFVPYIRTYRILIACTFFAWDMYLLHLSCGSMSECYTPWASALCSLMCVFVEFLVIPAHSSLLLPYNQAYMTMYSGKICASSSYTFVLCVCGFCSCLVHFES